MSGVGLEVLLEGLITEIAYAGEKGVSISELFKIVRKYHLSLDGQNATTQGGDAAPGLQTPIDDADLEKSLSDAEMSSARWAWDWLRSRPQILINGNKRWNRLELSEALALPEAEPTDAGAPNESQQEKGQRSKKTLTTRPRIHPSEDLVWQTLTRHGVDYKRVPALEWACLQGIATARSEGILQSDLRRLVGQDKRSLPKRTDSLARKGYIAKRTVVVQKMKTSRLWLIDFAPPDVRTETQGLDLSAETLSKDLEPVQWHQRWTGNNIDMDALGKTVVGIVKAFNVIRYSDLRSKMGVVGKRWQMKTLAKNCQRLVDLGVLKYTAASFPGSRKVFKDCLKFIKDPSMDEWEVFLATGKKTSQYSDPTRHREPKPNALALYGKTGGSGQKRDDDRSKMKRIFSGWAPEKPLAQTVFEVIQSAGPEGASNPQVSVATVGYQHRRYLSSYLSKVAETQQPPHLKKFQVVSKLVRIGKTSAYMFSAPFATGEQVAASQAEEEDVQPSELAGSSQKSGSTNPYGFGAIRPKAFLADDEDLSLSTLSNLARKQKTFSKRKIMPLLPATPAPQVTAEKNTGLVGTGDKSSKQVVDSNGVLESESIQVPEERPKVYIGKPWSIGPDPRPSDAPQESLVVTFRVAELNEQTPSLTTGFTPVNKDIKATTEVGTADLGSEDPVLGVRYNGLAGTLRLNRAERTLTFLRAGRGQKKPLVISIDDNLGEPTVRDVPGSDEKSLVCATGNKDPASSWTYIFVFGDELESQNTAALIQRQIVRLKNPATPEPSPAPNPAPAEAALAQEITVGGAPETNPSIRGGRGRGRGGARGRGRRGQALPPGVKPYVCPTCGGSWKNDLGLKYHLEKAQTPCNPNFDPATVLSRKRRRPSPAPPTSSANSDDEGGAPRSRRVKKSRKAEKDAVRFTARTGMRSTQNAGGLFRGLDLTDAAPVEESPNRDLQRARLVSKDIASQSAMPITNQGLPPEAPLSAERSTLPPRQFNAVGTRAPTAGKARLSTPAGETSSQEPTASIENQFTHPTLAVKTARATDPVSIHGGQSLHPTLPTAPSTPSAPRTYHDSLVAQNAFEDGSISPRSRNVPCPGKLDKSPPQDRYQGIPPSATNLADNSQFEPAQLVYPDPGPQYSSEQELQVSRSAFEMEPALSRDDRMGAKPFVPSSNYSRMATDAKRRTAQAFDIINYLLDNNCGVFPGDKALFYALTKVFLKEFRNQMPPTWKNCQSALKALETRKQAVLHTHMLRTEKGRLQTCTLLIRTGVDPNGMIPSIMKQKMRETYPGIFIPAAFSPTQEELALLQELDKKPSTSGKEAKPNANGQKFRSRRKYDEIEVFNAPYYTQSAPAAGNKKDPLWIRESEQLPGKRSAADGPPVSPHRKRTRTDRQETPTELGPSGFGDSFDDIPVDPNIMSYDPDASFPSPGHTAQQRDSIAFSTTTAGQSASGTAEPPSLVEAIKAYSLLPARLGGRGRRRSSTTLPILGKLPAELGRLRNPGLASLPSSFFSNANDENIQPTSFPINFLAPNTSLGDDAEESEEEQDHTENTSAASPGEVPGDAGDERPEAEVKEHMVFRFVMPSVLRESGKGIWPTLDTAFLEHHDSSFTIDGWMPGRKRLLMANVPSSAEQMAEAQKAVKIRPREWVDRAYAKFCSLVNQCAAWEQSPDGVAVMSGVNVAPHYVFINVSPPVSRVNSRTISLKWSDDTQFNLETLPYEDLEDDDYGDVTFVEYSPGWPGGARTVDRMPKKRRIQKPEPGQPKRAQGRPPKLKLKPIKTMREHTAYPKTPEDFLRVPGDDKEELDWSSENVRLTAFIVVTTLLGGVDRVVDWGLMLRLMPDQTISQLRHYWCALKKDRLSTIVSLTEKFRTAFLKAYENNELPPIDFDNVLAYDWKGLIKWTIQLDGTERRTLPASRKDLKENFTLTKFQHGNREWREAYFHPQRSVFNRFQDATSEALSLPIDSVADPGPSLDMVIAMSWTRSLCVTPVEAYSAEAVLHKRNALFPTRSKTEITELMLKGVDELQREGVISKSSSKWTNGRRWRFNTRVVDSLEKAAQQDKFANAVQFKRELDQAFRAGEKKKRVTYLTNDGMIMALLNLQANGRVRIETTGQPNVPMGHEPGNYETRKYTKKYMHFRLDIVPTETYLYDDGDSENNTDHDNPRNALLNLRSLIKSARPPTRGPGGAVPVWCDVFGKVDASRWLKYLSAVLITLASRGSMGPDELVKTLKPVIMAFEARLVMDWAAELGLLRPQIEGVAPAVMEWWWVAVECQREALMERGGSSRATVEEGNGSGSGSGSGRKALPSGRPVGSKSEANEEASGL
ncbi:hypothetical protein VTK26DRAFT_8668 [Humicola hyalothermophila]